MADNSKNLKNCRILARDSITGELIADTTVEGYDPKRNMMTLFAGALNGPAKNRLSLLALTKNGVLEYSGNLRKIAGGMAEIALYGERKKEDRNFTRYDMKTEGRVEALLIGDTRIDLRKPVPVFILNISANGILFRGDIDAFRRGSKVRVRVGLKDNSFVGEYEIVRSQNRNKQTAEYGCRNILPEGEQGDDEEEEIQDPKLRREEAAKKKIRNGEKIDRVETTLSSEESEASYDVLQQQMEQAYGYTDWLNRVAEIQSGGSEQDASEEALRALVEDICRRTVDTDEAVILNCVHRKRPEEERQSRHSLNLALLGALMGKWLHFDRTMIRKLVEMGLLEQTDEEEQGENRRQELYARILTVADLYDSRAAYPSHDKAGIPLVFLEQMRYRGIDQPAGSVKMLEWVLAENVLHCILHRKILLANRTIGQLLYVLPNDVEHPILAVKDEVYQEIAPWRLIWIILEPDALNGNRGEKH
ncbi:MAG: PilZ domain-containing protein [Acetatifactor sp.]|nr:PilZ domain-containing protein [Acetatifactor sp.]